MLQYMPSMQYSDDELRQAINYLNASDGKAVLLALQKATGWHEGQVRESGEPYIVHPIATASFLATLQADRDTLIAALLHDVVEDDRASLQEVKNAFGEQVAKLVDGVTKLSKLRYEGRRKERQVVSLRKLLLTANDDLRVIIIKLSDRRHNVETLGSLQKERRERIALETLDVYVPFARLVGLWEMKSFMEQVCFPIVSPSESKLWGTEIEIARSVVRKDRRHFVNHVGQEVTCALEAQMSLMTDYELCNKLQGDITQLQHSALLDSVLLLCNDPSATAIDCYQVLGEIHERYPVRVAAFRDYISAPQANGYQALHSTIFVGRDHQVRLRIQTRQMHEYATRRKFSWLEEKGHDVYKALGSLHSGPFDKDQYLTDLKQTVLSERINIFTASGDIITLPNGATGVDFAFAMNPDNISSLVGVRVNGELHEATFALQDGDQVDLALVDRGNGDLQTMWLEKVKSIETKASLKRSLRSNPKQQSESQGFDLLAGELQKRKLPIWSLKHLRGVQNRFAEIMERPSFSQLLEEIGNGIIPVSEAIDAYKEMITNPLHWSVRLPKFLGLLPRSRYSRLYLCTL